MVKVVKVLYLIIILIPTIVGLMVIGYLISYWIKNAIWVLKRIIHGKKKELTREELSTREILWFITRFYTYTIDARLNPIEKLVYKLAPQRCMNRHAKTINTLFSAGYCWHFAHLLKDSFGRGEVCWAVPFSHFVWKDEDDEYWDIDGIVHEEEYSFFIPEPYISDDILFTFKHTDYAWHNIEKFNVEDYMNIIDEYAKDNEFTYNREYVENMINRAMINHEDIPSDNKTKHNTAIKMKGGIWSYKI